MGEDVEEFLSYVSLSISNTQINPVSGFREFPNSNLIPKMSSHLQKSSIAMQTCWFWSLSTNMHWRESTCTTHPTGCSCDPTFQIAFTHKVRNGMGYLNELNGECVGSEVLSDHKLNHCVAGRRWGDRIATIMTVKTFMIMIIVIIMTIIPMVITMKTVMG